MKKLCKFMMLTVLVGLVSCSDGPKQYTRDAAVPKTDSPDLTGLVVEKKPDSQNKPLDANLNTAPKTDKLSAEENRKRVERNTQAPVIFGKSVAGITLDMNMKQAHKILSEPEVADGSNGAIGYNEGIVIVWKRDEPREIEQVVVRDAYLGEFKELTERFHKKVKMGTQFEEEFAKNGEEGFVKEVARALLKKDDSYDCIKVGSCAIELNGDLIGLKIPFGKLSFAADRKTLRAMALVPIKDAGNLDNPLDLINGRIEYNGEQGAGEITIGQSWGEALAKIGIDQKSVVTAATFGKSYGTVNVGVTRTKDVSRTYTNPRDDEKVSSFGTQLSYPHPIKFGDQNIEVKNTRDANGKSDVELKFVSEAEAKSAKSLVRMSMQNIRDQKLQYKFTEKLNEKILEKLLEVEGLNGQPSFVISQIKKPLMNIDLKAKAAGFMRIGGAVITQTLSGLQSDTQVGSLIGSTVIYDQNRSLGRAINYDFDRAKGSFNNFRIVQLSRNTDQLVAHSMADIIHVKDHELMGIKLGKSTVQIKDIDLGRSEATVTINSEMGNITERTSIVPQAALSLVFPGRGEQTFNVTAVNITTFGLNRLLLVKDQENYQLLAIESSQVFGGVKGLCGFGDEFIPRKGMSATEFMTIYNVAVTKAEEAAKKAGEVFDCPIHMQKDKDGTNELKAITFMKDGVVITFDQNELNTVLIYQGVGQ